MNVSQSIKVGLLELRSNKLRSLLTMLGVIFGVAAVIASVAIGEGAREDALAQIALMGTNNIRVVPVKMEGVLLAESVRKNPQGLCLADMDTIEKNCPYIQKIAPIVQVNESLRVDGVVQDATVIGTTPDYVSVMNCHPASGRFLHFQDSIDAARVCVVGAEIHEKIRGSKARLNGRILIGETLFTIIGVMEDKRLKETPGSTVSVRNINTDIYIPLTTALKRMDRPDENNELSELSIMVDQPDNILPATELIQRILLRMHGGVENVNTIIPMELLKQSQATQKRFNLVLAAVAGISLLVGGIGIMNIMLASVTQRIQEIGIRRAVGATRSDIMGQFLIEAVVLSIIGGLIGIGVGILLGHGISLYAKWNTVYSLKAILLSFWVAASVGIVFGIVPARKAARLNPIEALRHE